MPYAVALNYGGLSCLIGDVGPAQRLGAAPDNKPPAKDAPGVVLRSGVLFPGCIFVHAGEGEGSARFLMQATAQATVSKSPQLRWRQFRTFADLYTARNEPRFQVLLSERSTGAPSIYLFDSRSGLHGPWRDGSLTIGSGRKLLDPIVREHADALAADSAIFTREVPQAIWLRLMAMRQSTWRGDLDRAGVGEVFHFLSQNEEHETSPLPAVNLIVHGTPVQRFQHLSVVRTAYMPEGLSIERWTHPSTGAPPSERDKSVVPYPAFGTGAPASSSREGKPEHGLEGGGEMPLYEHLGVAPANVTKPGWQLLPWRNPPDFGADGSMSERLRVVIDNVLGDTGFDV